MNGFHGPFAELLEGFVELKRSTGFKYQKEAGYLRQFCDFCETCGITDPVITEGLSDSWCAKNPSEDGRNSTQQRVTCLRQFALYLTSIGHTAHIPINQPYIRQRKSEFSVYVFTHEEMDALFLQSNRVYPNRRSTMHLVMPTLLRLLYSTGIRVGEALGLRIEDIDLADGFINVKDAKFDKDRLLPISNSMLAILKQYCEVMHPGLRQNDFLFVGVSRTPYSHHEVYLRFREILVMAGIRHAGRGFGPRIHDVRHTFCCHTLQNAVEGGRELTNMLPYLSEYLGHGSLTATSQYLRMTAEVYPSVLSAIEKICSIVIPEVANGQA